MSRAARPRSATTWPCRACQARNALPPLLNTPQELLGLMSDPAQAARTVRCVACGTPSALIEVALRPSGWQRPAALRDDLTMQFSTVPWEVFRGEPRPDDIRQGGVGNCWLVCALSVLAEQPQLIRNVVLTRTYNPAGAYQVRLCRAGEWHTITVDDTFPTNALDILAYLKVVGVLDGCVCVRSRTKGFAHRFHRSFSEMVASHLLLLARRSDTGVAPLALGAAGREGRGEAPRQLRGARGRHVRRGLQHVLFLHARPVGDAMFTVGSR